MPVSGPSASLPDPAVQDASRRLEGVFLHMMFEEMAKTVPKDGLYGESPGMDVAQSWLRGEISERWAHSGGVGLGDSVARSVSDVSPDVAQPPVVGPVTSPFGPRIHPVTETPDYHEGVDIAAPIGSPVRAPFAGAVVDIKTHPHLGHTLVMRHAGGYRSVYGHLGQINVAVGDSVAAGAVVAESGDSGRATGPHLHFGLYVDGRAIDPSEWIPELKTVESMAPDNKSVQNRQGVDGAPDTRFSRQPR